MATEKAKEAPQTILQLAITLSCIGLLYFGWSGDATSKTLALWCWRATFALFLIAAIFSLVFAVSEFSSETISRTVKDCGLQILLWALIAPFFVFIYGGIAFGAFRLIDIVLDRAIASSRGGGMAVYGTIGLVLMGLLAYGARLKYRAVYGLVEFTVGCAIIYNRLAVEVTERAKFDLEFGFAIITAGLFLIVRGSDNIHQGYRSDPIFLGLIAKFLRLYKYLKTTVV